MVSNPDRKSNPHSKKYPIWFDLIMGRFEKYMRRKFLGFYVALTNYCKQGYENGSIRNLAPRRSRIVRIREFLLNKIEKVQKIKKT